MSSPVVVDDVLMQADAEAIHAWDLAAPGTPTPLWTVQLPANIESTPALWKGRLYVGAGRVLLRRRRRLNPFCPSERHHNDRC